MRLVESGTQENIKVRAEPWISATNYPDIYIFIHVCVCVCETLKGNPNCQDYNGPAFLGHFNVFFFHQNQRAVLHAFAVGVPLDLLQKRVDDGTCDLESYFLDTGGQHKVLYHNSWRVEWILIIVIQSSAMM